MSELYFRTSPLTYCERMIKTVKEALIDFSVNERNHAIILKGEWGGGKTHLWNQVINEKKEKFNNSYYSYVSLFGLNGLKDLKQAVYEGLVVKENANESGSAKTWEERFQKTSGFLRRNIKLLSGLRGVGPLIDSYQSSAIEDTLICFDDFERKGKGLSDAEVLGLISFLVEKRRCKVVLVLNEKEHYPSSSELSDYREKVFSYELEFRPSSRACAALVFKGDGESEKDLIEKIVKLDIRNVRLIDKISYFFNLVVDRVSITNPYILADIRCVLPLAVLARYSESQSPAKLAVLLRFDGWFRQPLPNSSPELFQEYKALVDQGEALKAYGYLETTELDVAVINVVLKGYLDQDDFDAVVSAIEIKLRAAHAEQIYSSAWAAYHYDYSLSQEQLLQKFDAAIEAFIDFLTVDRLGSLVRLFRELELNGKADELILRFFTRLSETRSLADRRTLFDEPEDELILSELNKYFDGFGRTMSLRQAIEFLMSSRSTVEAVAVLAQGTEADYFEYLTWPGGIDFREVVRFMLASAHETNVFEDALPGSSKKIFVAVYSALRGIKAQSKMNEVRLAPMMEFDDLYHSLTQS